MARLRILLILAAGMFVGALILLHLNPPSRLADDGPEVVFFVAATEPSRPPQHGPASRPALLPASEPSPVAEPAGPVLP